ncbi:response regulator [Candidatus Daviesbacteria bacterium]|nr:response regulator [Candidatus Daviesbacteria bacterium]
MDAFPRKILLTEDEKFVRDLYFRQLSKAGFLVKTAVDGKEALEKLKAEPFDLLLLDIMLPGMNGLQVLREFKTQNPTSPMITILLTQLGQEAVIKEGFKLGAHAYLMKTSYTPDQIINEVKRALGGQSTLPPNPIPTQ